MRIKLTSKGLRLGWHQLIRTLLVYPRWWETGVVTIGLLAGMAMLYWWLWRPLPATVVVAHEPVVQLDVLTLTQLATWATEREQAKATGEVAASFNALFK